MINKFPSKALNKWHRFKKIEKFFIVYITILIVSIVFFPIIKITKLSGWEVSKSFFNQNLLILDILLILTMLIFILWNISFRFKRILCLLLGFKSNDWFINFIILSLLIAIVLWLWETINFIHNQHSTTIQLTKWYYTILFLIIGWFIFNLFLSLNLSKTKKKEQLVKIIKNSPQDESQEENDKNIKSLFENEKE